MGVTKSKITHKTFSVDIFSKGKRLTEVKTAVFAETWPVLT